MAVTLVERAYHTIRDRILRGQLRLGDPISARNIACELGISHLPVSQAVHRLELEALLESRPRAGTRVRVPTEADIRERFVVREALESQSARLFCENALPAHRSELRRAAAHVDALYERCAISSEPPDFLYAVRDYHFHFHMRIASATRCRALCDLIEKNQVLIFNWLFDVAASRNALPPRFHRDLADVLTAGAPEEADAAMRAHVRYGLADTISNLRRSAAIEWRTRRGAHDRDA